MTKPLAIAAAALLLASSLHAQRPRVAPEQSPSRLQISQADEPGEPLVITGRVVGARGSPLAQTSLYVYQTDARGLYAERDGEPDQLARIHGYLRTDSAGRFEVRTIRPGGYPTANIVQHVHIYVNAPGLAERVVEIVFNDDPRMTRQIRSESLRPNGFYLMCEPKRNGGVQTCETEIMVR